MGETAYCKYCDTDSGMIANILGEDEWDLYVEMGDHHKTYLVISAGLGNFSSGRINYCPICGRDLRAREGDDN